jgi:hypothetical protein
MSDPVATVVVCDEMLISLTGKMNIFGIYTGDITIASEEQKIAQLVVIFHIECDLAAPPRALSVEVRLPGEPVIQNNIPPIVPPATPQRTKWVFRWPILIQQPTLRAGRIETKIVHDKGIIEPVPQLIVRTPEPTKH